MPLAIVRDIYFTYFMLALVVSVGAAYAVRIVIHGVARSERVGRIGGTAVLGQELMEWTYWAVDPVVKFLASLGITPNHLTWSALALGVGAGVAAACGWWGLTCMLATMSTIGDILDGQVARLTNSGSVRGELLDAAVDRYTEFAFLGGVAIYFREELGLLCLALAALLASFMVSYASAKAEALQVSPPRGLMRRHERSAYLIMGIGFSALLGPAMNRWWGVPWETPEVAALMAVAVIGNFAAIQRLVRIGQALR